MYNEKYGTDYKIIGHMDQFATKFNREGKSAAINFLLTVPSYEGLGKIAMSPLETVKPQTLDSFRKLQTMGRYNGFAFRHSGSSGMSTVTHER